MHSRRSPGTSATVAAPSPASRVGTSGAGMVSRDEPVDTLIWSSRPARLHPGRLLAALVALLLTLYVALTGFHSVLMALVGAIAVLGSLTEAFFPVHHRVSPSGASTRCAWQIRQMTWESVKSARVGPDGIHLSPLRDGSRLGRVRGVTLRFQDGNAQSVTDAVRTFLKRGSQ